MIDRKKVMRELECCGTAQEGLTCFDCPCVDINKNQGMGACTSIMANDALELLKEQEPRVLDIYELKSFAVVWFEVRNHLYIEPMLTRGKIFADASSDWFRYGKEWRCWTSQPTKEQCEAVKWND